MSAPLIAERLANRLTWKDLDPKALTVLIELARQEDLQGNGLLVPPAQTGDVTSKILRAKNEPASAKLVARENMVVCGLPLIRLILDAYGAGGGFLPACTDGTACPAGTALGTVSGSASALLEAERVILNFLQKLSGVATLTRQYVAAMGNTPTRLLDTRKTTPGYRALEKYAVACGGGVNHRMGLFDRIMLKDNHLAADQAGSGQALTDLVKEARAQWPDMVIELEVDKVEQITPTLGAGVDVYLLDNFSPNELAEAIDLIGDRAATEASGGITAKNLPAISNLGLDFISTGATIHQSTWKDIGLDWIESHT